MKWVKNKIQTITDKEGMFIEMLGSIMVLSSNVVTKYCVVYSGFTKNVKFT